MVSAPAPPVNVSSPVPEVIASSPSPPEILLSPFWATTTSLPLPSVTVMSPVPVCRLRSPSAVDALIVNTSLSNAVVTVRSWSPLILTVVVPAKVVCRSFSVLVAIKLTMFTVSTVLVAADTAVLSAIVTPDKFRVKASAALAVAAAV